MAMGRRENGRRMGNARMVAIVLLGAGFAAPGSAAALTCLRHESWTRCTADLDLDTWRDPNDGVCDTPIETAGFCVCKQEGCDAEANLVRIETACGDDPPTTCDERCAGYTSDLWI